MIGRHGTKAAGICSTLFSQYCIYFHCKKQSDFSFKNKENQTLAGERGYHEKGVDHLTNAVAVYGQTLPAPQFQMLLTKLPAFSPRTVSAQSLTYNGVEGARCQHNKTSV
uniref:Uncharacterized protein n=1 Tax=Peromyscus maniculatus bairdii TaxID=230844 RepID=A0A8C8UMN2_PERMB